MYKQEPRDHIDTGGVRNDICMVLDIFENGCKAER
jgi:hypothetical protein